jgi:hypothetical protein
MNKQFTLALCCLSLISIILSCSKSSDEKPVPLIEENNLTACPLNANCQYLFTEQADINPEPGALTTGNYRLFWSSVATQGISAVLYIKAPMKGDYFVLNPADITGGKIEIRRSCPACFFAASKVVDGYVRGLKLSPHKPADQTKWILEAQIISESVYGAAPIRDTLFVKQYFYPNFVYN